MQFGVMGAMLVAAGRSTRSGPSVGLLNIGVEDIKGNETVKRAPRAAALGAASLHGNVEGDGHLQGQRPTSWCATASSQRAPSGIRRRGEDWSPTSTRRGRVADEAVAHHDVGRALVDVVALDVCRGS